MLHAQHYQRPRGDGRSRPRPPPPEPRRLTRPHHDTDPHGRRVHLTRTGLRALASPGTPNYVLDRLRLALIGHALDALVNRRTLERIRELEEDADDADLHLATLQHHLGTGIDATIPRHPAGSAR
jgi:hypothetical protein